MFDLSLIFFVFFFVFFSFFHFPFFCVSFHYIFCFFWACVSFHFFKIFHIRQVKGNVFEPHTIPHDDCAAPCFRQLYIRLDVDSDDRTCQTCCAIHNPFLWSKRASDTEQYTLRILRKHNARHGRSDVSQSFRVCKVNLATLKVAKIGTHFMSSADCDD